MSIAGHRVTHANHAGIAGEITAGPATHVVLAVQSDRWQFTGFGPSYDPCPQDQLDRFEADFDRADFPSAFPQNGSSTSFN
ncbi:hypothetical protein ABTA44_19410, partial [Acinetobacter baumannii]